MAACSEIESESKPLQEKRLLSSKSFDSSTNKDVFDSRKPCNTEMSKSTVPIENTVDICSLTEEQLHSLLEEATTFNRPKEQDSSILRALRKEIVESDPCGDVNSGDSSALSVAAASVAAVAAGHGKRKSGRNIASYGSCGTRVKTPQITDDLLMVNSSALQGWTKSEINSSGNRRRWQNKAREDQHGANAKRELQSQSLQDLPSTRFGDPSDSSMRAAGVGRGNRRLHNPTRANSFTYTGDGAEWLAIPALQSQISTLDNVRTTNRNKNKAKSKTSSNSACPLNPQTVLTIDDDTDITRGVTTVISPSSNSGGASGEKTRLVGPKGWSHVSAPTSSPESAAKTPLLTFASCDNCEQSEVSLLSCRPLDDADAVENVKSNINGGLGVIETKASEAKNATGAGVPLEIEMLELDRGKSQSLDLESRSTFVYNLDGNCRGGIDCRAEVDASLQFPLKPGRACAPVNKNEIICPSVRGPGNHINGLLPMGDRSETVKSIIGNDDSRKDDMFYQNVDYNGNPANNLMRISNTFLAQGYPFESHQTISKGDLAGGNASLTTRKAKRSKSNAEKKTYSKSEDVPGFCGQLEVDLLVEFINSSGNDKKRPGSKSVGIVTVNNNNKNGGSVEDKKPTRERASNRDAAKGKNGFKRKSGVSSSGSSEEHADNDANDNRAQSGESDDGDMTPVRNVSPVSDVGTKEDKHVPLTNKEKTSSSPASLVSSDRDFVEDFYSVAEVATPVEESEFRVVVNKQRKRKQAKKGGEPSFRRYSNASNGQGDRAGNNGSSSERDFYLHNQQCHSSGMLIYSGMSHRNRGKPDPNRRKSTSSMPPSEPSSADNSDLDSVHSLPVVGSMPPSTGPHPHTTPSSIASTPQASYADIARMASSGTCPSKKEPLATQSCHDNNNPNPRESPKEEPKTKTSENVTTIITTATTNTTSTTTTATIIPAAASTSSVDKPTVAHVSTSPMVSIPTGPAKAKPAPPSPVQIDATVQCVTVSPRELDSPEVDKTAEFSRGSSQETVVISAAKDIVKDNPDIPSDHNPHNPQLLESTTSTPSSITSSSGQMENPVINQQQPVAAAGDASRVCDVSFGFDLNELMRLSEGGVPVTFEFEQQQQLASSPPAVSSVSSSRARGTPKDVFDASSTHSSLSDATIDSVSLKTEPSTSEASPPGTADSLDPSRADESCLVNVVPSSACAEVVVSTSDNLSSPGENVVVVSSGKRLQFKDKLEETQSFNHVQVANFFGSAWDNTIQDYHKDGAHVGRPDNKPSGRICYYNSSQC